jgi:hypothetical protein
MSRMRRKIAGTLAAVLAATALVPAGGLAQSDGSADERTATELGQAVGESGEARGSQDDAVYSRTSTELGQSVLPGGQVEEQAEGSGWSGVALVAAIVALGGSAALALRSRRRQMVARPAP